MTSSTITGREWYLALPTDLPASVKEFARDLGRAIPDGTGLITIAEVTDTPAASAKRYLARLADEGLIHKQQRNRGVYVELLGTNTATEDEVPPFLKDADAAPEAEPESQSRDPEWKAAIDAINEPLEVVEYRFITSPPWTRTPAMHDYATMRYAVLKRAQRDRRAVAQ